MPAVSRFDLPNSAHLMTEMMRVDLHGADLDFGFLNERKRVDEALGTFSKLPEHLRAHGARLVNSSMELICRAFPKQIRPSLYRRLIAQEWLAMVAIDQRHDRPPARGHVFHPPAVATTGWWFLTKRKTASGELCQDIIARWLMDQCRSAPFASALSSDQWCKVVRIAWIMASLLHDICYPFELLGRHGAQLVEAFPGVLEGMRPSMAAPTHAVSIDEIASKMAAGPPFLSSPNALEMVRDHLEHPGNAHSHASLGAVFLLSLVEKISNPLSRAAVYLAAEAVLLHHTTEPSHLEQSPLGFLLHTSDWLQEWCRVLLKPLATQGSGNTTISAAMPCRAVRLSGGDTYTDAELSVELDIDPRRHVIKRCRERFSWQKDIFLQCKANELPREADPSVWVLAGLLISTQ